MSSIKKFVYPLALLALAISAPSMAASSASSAASDSIGASLGSSSTSIEKSSGSSAHAAKLAQGDYAITEVVAAADRPNTLRLTLHAVATEQSTEDLYLYVPAQTVAQAQLAQGQTVSLTKRAYGAEFAKSDTKQAFFLVLHEEWLRELPSNPVTI